MIKYLKKFSFINTYVKNLSNVEERRKFVKEELSKIDLNSKILDAGCGSQQYKVFCGHLKYKSQDFGGYKIDDKKSLSFREKKYEYGDLDYVGNIWEINEKNNSFDAILCTEVFEHIPYPIETVKEFSRLLKKNGKLILTTPSNSLRHYDPYFFYPGFSDRWFEEILVKEGFEILQLDPIGDYYSWMKLEIARTMFSHSFISKLLLFPALIYYSFKKKNETSINTLCSGYHVVAKKIV